MIGLILSSIALFIALFFIKSIDEQKRKVFLIKWKYPIFAFACTVISLGGVRDYISYREKTEHDEKVFAQLKINLDASNDLKEAYDKFELSKVEFSKKSDPLAKDMLEKNISRLSWAVGNQSGSYSDIYPIIISNKSDFYVDLGSFKAGGGSLSYKASFYSFTENGKKFLSDFGRYGNKKIVSPGETVNINETIIAVGRPYQIKAEISINPFVDHLGKAIDFNKESSKNNVTLTSLMNNMKENDSHYYKMRMNFEKKCRSLYGSLEENITDSEGILDKYDFGFQLINQLKECAILK